MVKIIFFLFALCAMWFASVPQATMLVAEPVYQLLAPELDVSGKKCLDCKRRVDTHCRVGLVDISSARLACHIHWNLALKISSTRLDDDINNGTIA